MKKEEWKQIEGYEGYYEISSFGRIRNTKIKNKIVKAYKNNKGYLRVQLYKNGEYKNHCVHRLVATSFIPNPENKEVVNHIDYNRQNNNVKNLEWTTYQENSHHSMERIVESQLKNKMSCTKHHNIYPNHKGFVVKVRRYGKEIINKTFRTIDAAIAFLVEQRI